MALNGQLGVELTESVVDSPDAVDSLASAVDSVDAIPAAVDGKPESVVATLGAECGLEKIEFPPNFSTNLLAMCLVARQPDDCLDAYSCAWREGLIAAHAVGLLPVRSAAKVSQLDFASSPVDQEFHVQTLLAADPSSANVPP